MKERLPVRQQNISLWVSRTSRASPGVLRVGKKQGIRSAIQSKSGVIEKCYSLDLEEKIEGEFFFTPVLINDILKK
jgi:hypothetical protein